MAKGKRIMKRLIIIIVVIVTIALFFSMSYNREFWCQQAWIGCMRNVVEYFWCPNDLFLSVFKEDIDISKKNYSKEFVFEIKYVGPYEIGLFIDKLAPDLTWEEFQLKLSLKIDFYINNKLTYSISTGSDYYFISRGRSEGFLALQRLKVPKNLGRGKKIKCHVTVLSEDKDFYDKFGPTKLGLLRRSEL
ncbi:MAG: hypothetical protein C4541_09345 [Candidatus Auribacter fodinae]|uniref:Uncharacterized protein n=1 Tax=Candidatus Auribacter fodinae TaxID=2093366 RepID=A0A3A4QZY5_9BACT|nr:MAG: hypothetical protein C4541_09345 [Candidatus Auribacter fodinae]